MLERIQVGRTKAGLDDMNSSPIHNTPCLPDRTARETYRATCAGFTLIEVLTVLAVVSVLMAILLPAIGKARSTAKSSTCMARLRQWGLGTHLYAMDASGCLPGDGAPNGWSTANAWYADLPPMLGMPPYHAEGAWRTNAMAPLGHPLWFCPSNPRRSNGHLLFHYALNRFVNGSGRDSRRRRLEDVGEASRVVWLFDNGQRAAVAGPGNLHRTLHRGAANLLMLDGGVRRQPAGATTGTQGNSDSLLWEAP